MRAGARPPAVKARQLEAEKAENRLGFVAGRTTRLGRQNGWPSRSIRSVF
jgi:hypothetical protein